MEVLKLNKQILKILTIWVEGDSVKSYKWTLLFFLCSVLTAEPVLSGFARQLYYGVEEISAIIDDIIGVADYLYYLYVVACFFSNSKQIKAAIRNVEKFSAFCSPTVICDAENKVRRLTKGVLIYAFVGLFVNSALPLLSKNSCPARPSEILQQRDPCGLIVRSFFPVDISYSPYFELGYLTQAYCTVVVVITVLSVTLCLLGLLIHLMAQIKNCRKAILNIFQLDPRDAREPTVVSAIKMNFCIEYHIAITKFALEVGNAFSSMMLIHLTMTSIAISALGYQIIMEMGSHATMRFIMQLSGWMFLLFFTCYYGQKLIDESSKLSVDAYNSGWYIASLSTQKSLVLFITRTQKPLELSAASLGVMSYETFLQVLKSAYSYLTLLLTVTK